MDVRRTKEMLRAAGIDGRSDAFLCRLLETAFEGICMVDAEDRIVFANARFGQLLGVDALGLAGRRIQECVERESWAGAREMMVHGSEVGETCVVRFRRDDGIELLTLLAAFPFLRAGGSRAASVMMVTDITEHRRSEDILRQAERDLRRFQESTKDAFVRVDVEGRILSCNAAYRELVGYSEEELRRMTYMDLTPQKWHEMESRLVREQLLQRRYSDVYEKEYRRKDGTVFPVELRTFLIADDSGQTVAMGAIVRDITDRQQLQESLSQLSARLLRLQDEERRYLARELHDTTAQGMAAVQVSLSLLQVLTPDLNEKARKLLNDSLSMVDQCANELRTRCYLLHPPLLDDLGLVLAVKDYAQGFAARSGIRVEMDLPEDLPRLHPETELALFRVIQESLSNVHRHSGSPTAVLCLSTEPDRVRLSITDQGRGMPALSSTGSSSATRLGVGILGMTERVRQLGGHLKIESNGHGTAVTVVVPLVKPAPVP